FNALTIGLGALSLPLVFAYPFAKRITYWPQIVLGLVFNWGALVGWTAVEATMAVPAVVLYAACIAWTVGYDTIYAHQDKADDRQAGVRSSALALGRATRPFLFAVYLVAWAGFAAAAWLAGLGWPAVAALAPAALHLLWQAARVDLDRPADCLAKFRANVDLGWLVAAGLVIALVLAGGSRAG
ncbi:MAG: UbiA family prenyltransferase, partial [Alphaproteobacteria bacterium]